MLFMWLSSLKITLKAAARRRHIEMKHNIQQNKLNYDEMRAVLQNTWKNTYC